MGFSKTDATVDEHRVVSGSERFARNGLADCVSELIAFTHDEGVERILSVELKHRLGMRLFRRSFLGKSDSDGRTADRWKTRLNGGRNLRRFCGGSRSCDENTRQGRVRALEDFLNHAVVTPLDPIPANFVESFEDQSFSLDTDRVDRVEKDIEVCFVDLGSDFTGNARPQLTYASMRHPLLCTHPNPEYEFMV